MNKNTTILMPRCWIFGLAIAVVAATAAAQAPQEPPPAKVRVAVAQKQVMAPQLHVPGTVISRNDARIAAELSGRLVWVAEVGSQVEKGDTIARIDDRMWQLQLQEDEAIIKRLEASLRYRRQDVERLEELAATNITPISRLEEAESRRDMTEQDLVQAGVARERTLYQLEHTKVRAPFSGRIVERLLEPGEYSTAGDEVARLADTRNVEVRAQIPVSIAPFLSDGMAIGLDGQGAGIEGSIRAIIPVADEVTRMFEIRISVPSEIWVIGSAVKVSVPNGARREVIAVPRDALILRSDNTYVFRINGDDIAERVIVRTGSADGVYIEVTGQIQDGDRVVVRGGERLREGQKVSAEAIS